jgi:phosphoglycolate phosphatase
LTEHVLLFDLDGTLMDAKPGILACVRHALDELSRPCPPEDVLVSFLGPPLRLMFSSLLETSNKELIEKAVALYRKRYSHNGIFDTRVYDGVPTMLEWAQSTVKATFVVTSKITVYTNRILEHFGLNQYFSGVYGAEPDGRFDNKADLLGYLLAKKGIPPEVSVMVGDRAADVLAAKANRAWSIGVLWGYGSVAELTDAKVDRLCAAPYELASCLSQITI